MLGKECLERIANSTGLQLRRLSAMLTFLSKSVDVKIKVTTMKKAVGALEAGAKVRETQARL